MWRYAVPVVLFLLVAAFLYRGLHLSPGQEPSPLIGQPATEFSLPSLLDPSVTVGTDDFRGKLTLLNVWATWCEVCYYEHDFLVQLAEEGVPIYGFNWKDDREAALEWLATLGNPYVASARDELGDIAIDYGVYGAPETFLIGPDLTILQKHTGQLTREVWEKRFVPVIEAHGGVG